MSNYFGKIAGSGKMINNEEEKYMKNGKNWKSFAAGMTMAVLCALAIPTLAAGNSQTLQNVLVGGIRIVIDGQELHPTDASGNPVSPMIYNGTTYLPVRAVASALGKAVYWDGPNYTVYLGNMDGQLEYPTVMLEDMKSIDVEPKSTARLTDNYGNRYGSAVIWNYGTINHKTSHNSYEYLLNMKYSRFKGTLYVPEGETKDYTITLSIKADGRILYTSPAMSKSSAPVKIDVDVTGYNDVKLEWTPTAQDTSQYSCCLADAGFYQ